ncbi:MAG: DNA-binding protein [Oscillospiraceae bacterium]|nr:DNA-binding protein [Oscillospiraceae bacterium]
MAEKMFMRVSEVASVLDVSEPYSYKLIRKMNGELKKSGCITISGRVDRRFFYEKFYTPKKPTERTE